MIKLFHPKHGELTPVEKKYQPLGNKIDQLYADSMGNRHTLDGTEKPIDEIKKGYEQSQTENQDTEKQGKIQELSDEMDFEKNLDEQDQKEAEKETEIRNHTELLEAVKNAPQGIVEAVKSIPETKIEIPDHFKEQEQWKNDIIEAIQNTVENEPDYSEIIKAIKAVKFPEVIIPESKDYTKLLKDIKDALPENTDLSGIEKLIKNLKPFELPEKMITKEGRLKVEVDRIAVGGGGGGLTATESIAIQGVATEETLQAVLSASGGVTYNEAYGKGVLSSGYYYWGYLASTGTAWRIKRLSATTNAVEWSTGASGLSTAWAAKESQSFSATL